MLNQRDAGGVAGKCFKRVIVDITLQQCFHIHTEIQDMMGLTETTAVNTESEGRCDAACTPGSTL